MRQNCRILVSAYAIDARKGSEPGAGWQFVKGAALYAEHVHVLTRSANSAHLLRQLEGAGIGNVHVVGVDGPELTMLLKERVPAGKYLYYFLWQHLARKRARELHKAVGFDLAHHVTYASDWLPTSLMKNDIQPWIWGPVGGRAPIYPRLLRHFGVKGSLTEVFRYVGTAIPRALFGVAAARRATLTLAQNTDVAEWAEKAASGVKIFPNPIVELAETSWVGQTSTSYIGVGRLLPWKGWSIVIEAFSLTPRHLSLEIFGAGNDLARLEARVAELGLGGRIKFRGSVTREVLIDALRRSRGLVTASLRDSAGWSVAEAITIGVPVIAVGAAGIGTLAGQSDISSVSPRSQSVVEDLAALISSPPRPTKSKRWLASTRYKELWQVYDSVIGEARNRGLERGNDQ